MEEVNEQLKQAFAQFIDSLPTGSSEQQELLTKSLKRDLQSEMADIRQELRSFKEAYQADRKQLEALFADVHKAVHTLNDHKQRLDTLETTGKPGGVGADTLIEKVALFVAQQQESVEERLTDITERLKHNEKILYVTRGDHETLTTILKKFSNGLSLINDDPSFPLKEDRGESTATMIKERAQQLVEQHHETVMIPIIQDKPAPLQPQSSLLVAQEMYDASPNLADSFWQEPAAQAENSYVVDTALTLDPVDTQAMRNLDNMFIV